MMSNISNVDRKTLILTGASRGIGHATVKRFSSAGWRVITCSRHAFPEDCPWEMGPEDHIQVDLADGADTERAIADMKERLTAQGSRLNALVNNAAISPKGPDGGRPSAIDTPLRDWQWVFQVNFFAPIMLARGLLEELERAQGAVVNVTSIAGVRVHPFAGAAYGTSKAALAALTREMAHESGVATFGSTQSHRARSTPRSCRRVPRRSLRIKFRCNVSGSPRRSPRRYTSCARTNRVMSPERNCTLTVANTFKSDNRLITL